MQNIYSKISKFVSTTQRIICGVVALTALSGCASAESVQRDPGGGVVALSGRNRKAMADARGVMSRHCGGVYTIVAEERVKVGEETRYHHYDDNEGCEVTFGRKSDHKKDHSHHHKKSDGEELAHSVSSFVGAFGADSTTSNVYEKWLTYRCE